MSREPRARRRHARRLPGTLRAAAGLTLLALAPGFGCGREFFRQWADQDVTEAIFEKSRDPRWRLPTFSIEPPALSRFADPYDVDRPPAPPDDYAAQALSPTAQIPHMRVLTPVEGTGYLEMLQAGPRYEGPAPTPEDTIGPAGPEAPAGTPATPPPAGLMPSPFAPGAEPEGLPDLPVPGASERILGPEANPLTPNNRSEDASSPAPAPGTLPQTRLPERDPGVQSVAFQAPGAPATSPGDAAQPAPLPTPGLEAQVPAGEVGEDLDRPDVLPPDLSQLPPRQPGPPPITRPGAGPAEVEEINQARSSFAEVLSPAYIDVDQAEAAGLPVGSRPYMVGPAQALQLGLINSRDYQFQLENVYLQSLTVTLQRFAFEPQFYAGTGSITAPLGIPPGGSGPTSFLYRTKEAPGGQASSLSLTEAAGFGKAFVFGGRLLAGFANQTVFNFIGLEPQQPTVQSSLPLSFVQPFLRGGGRAVTLEPLTLAERQLLYQVRSFARFRQQFMVALLTAGGGGFAGGGGDPTIGFLNVLGDYQVAENTARIVAAYERSLQIFQEYARNSASSGISQLQVDQVDLQLQQQRVNLIGLRTQYRISLDQYKTQLGLPPDLPIIPDLSILRPFSQVFREIIEWQRLADHDPADLDIILSGLPELPNIVLDGRPLFDTSGEVPRSEGAYSDTQKQEEFLLTAERIALENRLDLMNQRAILYDVWRQIAVQANQLLPVFTVTYSGNLQTPPNTTNPFGFTSESLQSQLAITADLPLVRLNERNNFRVALVNYQRQRRTLMQQEDTVKLQVRNEARQLIQSFQQYQVQKRSLELALRNRDQTLQQIVAPPAEGGQVSQATQTLNLIQSLSSILQQQNSLVSSWITYQSTRLAFYRDLGTLPYDEWEAYYELYPSAATRPAGGAGAGGRPADPAPDVIPAPELNP